MGSAKPRRAIGSSKADGRRNAASSGDANGKGTTCAEPGGTVARTNAAARADATRSIGESAAQAAISAKPPAPTVSALTITNT
ncbi:hypothetical protein GCM10009416_19350 [Craurococcus roseus]|uniref:Uncharacterized protein n=1 Tax=Craurococcus roseus TaxID=77585 RepID=A0ABN1F3D0_9PROT